MVCNLTKVHVKIGTIKTATEQMFYQAIMFVEEFDEIH